MRPRLELHAVLLDILDGDKAYFQPPSDVKMVYPCIVYKRDYAETTYSANMPYTNCKRYMVTVIDRDPDSNIPDKIAALPMTSFERHFTADGLNHDVFNLYF